MKNRIVTIAALACSILYCTAAERIETNGLTVRISSDRRTLTPGDTMRVRVEITNSSTNELVIHTIPNPWEWLIVTDEAGTEYPSYPNCIPSLLPPSPEHFTLLVPGATHTGVHMATLAVSHSASNAHWQPRHMKLVAGMRDYDLPAGPARVHYMRREFAVDQLKVNCGWRSFSDCFRCSQWIGELRSTNIQIEARTEQPTKLPSLSPKSPAQAER